MEILSLLLEVVLTQTHNYLGKNHHPSKRNIQKKIFFSDRKIDIIKKYIKVNENKICSVQFIHSVMSNSLQHHGLQHARLLCPSPIP